MAGFWGLLRESADSVCHHEWRQRKHMAKIRDTKGRDEGGSGYVRLLGNEELGVLLSKTHATVIRNGNELEHLIAERCPFRCSGLEQRLAVGPVEILGGGGRPEPEVYFSERIAIPGHARRIASDIVLLRNSLHGAAVIELKDGDTFDTKKAQGELESMSTLADWIATAMGYEVSMHFCCFNQQDKTAIIVGTKGRFTPEQVLTGRELCQWLCVDYAEVQRQREEDAKDNYNYFVSEVFRIVGME